MSNLQLFLGIDKNNPLFSIYSVENRNHIPCRPEPEPAGRVFLHHAGIMLFLPVIFTLTAGLPLMRLSRQWLMSVLVNDKNMTPRETVTAIFSRWIQENDFLYEIRHFGINQITSYDFEDYGSLKESLIEKTVWSDEYISQKIMLNSLNKPLMELLIKKGLFTRIHG